METIINISFFESLRGFSRELTHLDDRKIPINKIGASQFDELMKITGEGMKGQNNSRGNLNCRIRFSFPEKLNEQ